jgi:hypothetical protein
MCDDSKVHANMENDGDWASNYETPEFLTSGGPSGGNAAEQASPVAQRASQTAERIHQPRWLCNRYPCVTEIILCNMCIVTYHIDALLQKHFELPCNKILVFVSLFLDEFLEHAKVLLNRIKVRRVWW